MSGVLDLNKFCEVGDIRGYLNHPFPAGLFWCATNGHVMAMTAGDGSQLPKRVLESLPARVPPRLLEYAHEVAHQEFTVLCALTGDLVQIEPEPCSECNGSGRSSRTTCPECDGEGEVELESDYNTYEVDCKMCRGNGYIKHKTNDMTAPCCEVCDGSGKAYGRNQRVSILSADIQPQYFDLIKSLDGVEVCALKLNNYQDDLSLGFRQVINGQVVSIGLIMGLRK